jgi:hypothetical protein
LINLMLITNHPEIARYAADCGVQRIFVDLEINGKEKRQGHLNTVISRHSMNDVYAVRQAALDSQLLVRINPLYAGTRNEVEEAIQAGADLIMLPMFYSATDVKCLSGMVDGRCGIIPLVETPQAMIRIREIVKVEGVSEVYFGLNDLHLALGLNFMFELVSSGVVEFMADAANRQGIPFGFGGLAKFGAGLVPGEAVLTEHVRLGSQSVILSRSFHGSAQNLQELMSNVDLRDEILMLRELEARLLERDPHETDKDREQLHTLIESVVSSIYEKQEWEKHEKVF